MRVVDLGCGTGQADAHAARAARRARRRSASIGPRACSPARRGSAAAAGTALRGRHHRVVRRRRRPSPHWDLIFSNAALHWVDDHERLIERLAAALAPGGQLAFQVPAQHDTLTHRLADELAAAEPFAIGASAAGAARSRCSTPDAYARLLYRCGFADPKVQLIVYPHVLASRDDVVEWVKGTMLTEYKRHLPEHVYDQFVDRVPRAAAAAARRRAAVLLPVQADTLLGAAVRLKADTTRDA